MFLKAMLTRDRADAAWIELSDIRSQTYYYYSLLLQATCGDVDLAASSKDHFTSRERRIVVPSARFPANPASRPPKRWISTNFNPSHARPTATSTSPAHPSHPDDFDPDKYRQYAWCFRSRCPGGQVHQCLRCLLEASGKAPHPWFVSPIHPCANTRTRQTNNTPTATVSRISHTQEEELRQWNYLVCLAQQARTLEQHIWRNLNLVRDEGRMSSEALFELVLTRLPSTGWSDTVKTGHLKELPPQSIDW
jgi:hypothetical protein